jgi:hypothetical protein
MKNKKANSDLEFINRIESASCWRVRLYQNHHLLYVCQNFSDKAYGNDKKALKAAKDFRNWIVDNWPRPEDEFELEYNKNKRGRKQGASTKKTNVVLPVMDKGEQPKSKRGRPRKVILPAADLQKAKADLKAKAPRKIKKVKIDESLKIEESETIQQDEKWADAAVLPDELISVQAGISETVDEQSSLQETVADEGSLQETE